MTVQNGCLPGYKGEGNLSAEKIRESRTIRLRTVPTLP
jgi:hypothetical protein